MVGWVTWWGWISLLAGVSNLTAIILQNMVALNDPSYVSKQWHIVLLIYAVVVTGVLVNIFTYKLVPKIELLAGICHVCLFVIFMVVLVVLGQQQRHTAEYVFTNQTVQSGWKDTFVAWNIGMLTCTWSFTGFDGALHMSEEVRKAKHAVPRALFWTIALNGIMAYGMVLALLFASGSLTDVLESSFPVMVILQNLTGSTRATTALVSGLFIISYCVGLASIASVSRLTWAWARDGGLPATFSYVNNPNESADRQVGLTSANLGQPSLPSPNRCSSTSCRHRNAFSSTKHWQHSSLWCHRRPLFACTLLFLFHSY